MLRGLGDQSEPRFLVIGVVTKPHGVAGHVRILPKTDLPERFAWLKEIHLAPPNNDRPTKSFAVEKARLHKGMALLKLAGVDDRLAADALRSMWAMTPEAEAIPLEEGEYFLFELIGVQVRTVAGISLGAVSEIIETGANNVFVVTGNKGETLLPDIDEVILEIDLDAGIMTVDPLPGLL